ncbi:MAG: DNA polymerase III subunit gamma/tau [Candidatus Saccharimonadales bacterium]
MGKLALYRHYRSADFSELVGQDYVSQALENAIKAGSISHAYLFTGPRGVGKTSAARILARRVNDLKEAVDHPDIIEIDAASNNGVEEIRELREKVHVAPNYSKYKVYIIDEVHMLSTAAFNALLKTLEEPPSHVIFVLATTEPHKLPQTIISRTQHFPFQPISPQAVTKHLRKIADLEKIKIDDEALELITELGEGSMRDSISLLDQVGTNSTKKITVQAVESLVGLAETKDINKLLNSVEAGDSQEVIRLYDGMINSGVSPQILIKQLLITLRSELRDRLAKNEPFDTLSSLLESLSRLPNNLTHIEFALEVLLLKNTNTNNDSATKQQPSKTQADTEEGGGGSSKEEKKEAKQAAKKIKKTSESKDNSKTSVQNQAQMPEPTAKAKKSSHKEAADKTDTSKSKSLDNQTWLKALSIIKAKNQSLYSLLANTDAMLDDEKCKVEVKFQFHYKRLIEPSNYELITKALKQATGSNVELEVIVGASSLKSRREKSQKIDEPVIKDEEDLDAIAQVTSILGGEAV